MRYFVSAVLFGSVSLSMVASAAADDSGATPAFALMDNTGDGSRVNLDVAKVIGIDRFRNESPWRFSFLGQYVTDGGFGGYLGISAFKTTPAGSNGDDLSFGDLELGGLYHHALSREMDLGIRLGIATPSTSDGVRGSGIVARPADLVTALPDTTWLRIGVSPTYHSGLLFLRTDLGVDVPVHDSHGIDPITHVNFGAGIEKGGVTATAELQNVFETGNSFAALQSVGLSVRYQGKWISPYVSASTPLDVDGLFGKIVTVSAGVTMPF